VFLGNNARGISDYESHISAEQILLGFLGVGGCKEADYIRLISADTPTIWIGSSRIDSVPRLQKTVKCFNEWGFNPEIPYDIDGWLKCHLALILPLAGAIYGANGDNYRLARTPALTRLMLQGLKETIRVMRQLNIKVEPGRLNTLSRMPVWLLNRLFSKRMGTRESEISLAGHAGAARDEMRHLANEFQKLIDRSGVDTPAYSKLMEYLRSDDLIVEDGLTTPLL
jgi:2-dehydropantoate 2-reductase